MHIIPEKSYLGPDRAACGQSHTWSTLVPTPPTHATGALVIPPNVEPRRVVHVLGHPLDGQAGGGGAVASPSIRSASAPTSAAPSSHYRAANPAPLHQASYPPSPTVVICALVTPVVPVEPCDAQARPAILIILPSHSLPTAPPSPSRKAPPRQAAIAPHARLIDGRHLSPPHLAASSRPLSHCAALALRVRRATGVGPWNGAPPATGWWLKS